MCFINKWSLCMLISETCNLIYYVDRNLVLHQDNSNSILRRFFELSGLRNYDSSAVFKAAVLNKTSLEKNEIKNLSKYVAKNLKIKTSVVINVFNNLKLNQKKWMMNESKSISLAKKCALSLGDKFNLLKKLNSFDNFSKESEYLTSIIKKSEIFSKWSILKLDQSLFESNYEDILFLVESRLIHSIIGLQNSTLEGKDIHGIKIVENSGEKEIFIKKDGEWVSLKQIRANIQWNSAKGILESKSNSNERWNYLINGLTPIDRHYDHKQASETTYSKDNEKLHPVAKLSAEEMEILLKRAKKFDGFTIENHSGEQGKLNCVVQFITNPHIHYSYSPALMKNLNGQFPFHASLRLVFSDGTVYSTGLAIPHHENTVHAHGGKILRTLNSQPAILDYEEFRPHHGRIITNVPVEEAKAIEILDQLNHYRKQSVRFNIFKQNCVVMAKKVLKMSGTDLNLRIPLSVMLYRALPDLETIPVMGKPLKFAQEMISSVRQVVGNVMPEFLKNIFSCLSRIVFYVPNLMGVVLQNLIALQLGGRFSYPQVQLERKEQDPSATNDYEMENFLHLSSGLFGQDAINIEHSSVFINWQLEQKSTDVFEFLQTPDMNIVTNTNEYSETRKNELKDLYKYSVAYESLIDRSADDTMKC